MPKKPPRNKTHLTSAEYEDLGKMLVNIYETGYLNTNQSYKMAFIKGLLGGLGGVIGATIVVGILLWVLTLLGHSPLGPATNKAANCIRNQRC